MCGCICLSGRPTHPRAATIDHLTPHKGDEALFYDPENLWLVCKQCHDGPCAEIERLHPGGEAAAKALWRHDRYDDAGRPTDATHPWNAS